MLDAFGWDLLLKTIKEPITKEADMLVLFAHWNIILIGGKCIGCGEQKTLSEAEKQLASELIPKGWNKTDGNYTLRYIFKGQLYILYGIICENLLLFNWFNVEKNNTTNIALDIKSVIKSLSGPIEDVVNDYAEQMYNLNKNLLENSILSNNKDADCQTEFCDDSTMYYCPS